MQSLRVLIGLISALTASAATIPGDAMRGAELFEEQKCIYCHSANGRGGVMAPDLSKRPDGPYTPALLAATVWNHAPRMWTAIDAAGIKQPILTVQDSADLFAYFYSFRYFEKPGDAGRGKQVFDAKGCIACHGASEAGAGGAPPAAKWGSISDPIELARAMWNHAPKMRQAMSEKMTWPTLSGQEMTDLLVYVQNLPGARASGRRFSPASPVTGEVLFRMKGCSGCHIDGNALEGKMRGRTLAELAAGMWNHAPQMRERAAELRPEEMVRLVGYLWSVQYFDDRGDLAKGSRIADQKRCTTCHGASGNTAPDFAELAGQMDAIGFVSQTWRHGPAMLEQMKSAQVDWPRFEGNDLSHLLAYINSLR